MNSTEQGLSRLERAQQAKQRYEKYREAARRLSGGRVSHLATPVETIDGTGAFVEVVIWVPIAEITEPNPEIKEPIEPNDL